MKNKQKMFLRFTALFIVALLTNTGFAQKANLQEEVSSGNSVQVTKSLLEIDEYCIPAGHVEDWFYTDDFLFAGIENIGSGYGENGYNDFTNMQASVELGATYTLSIKVGPYAGNIEQVAQMWIDLDGNELFEENELLLKNAFVDTTRRDYSIDIPNYALEGITRLRLVSGWDMDSLFQDPCHTGGQGEWEDYSVEIIGNSSGLDATAQSINFNPPIFTMGNIIPKATVANWGTSSIDFDVTCTIDGTSYISSTSTPVLEPGETFQVIFDAWDAEAIGVYNMNITTLLAGDENPENDTFTGLVTILETLPAKRVYAEEGTGTWCGWCVRGTVAMQHMRETYPDTWIGVAVHNDDPMVNEEWNYELGFVMFPNMNVNRSIIDDISIESTESQYESEINKTAIATIEITSFEIDEANNMISFLVESEFIINAESCRFSAAIIENGVTGSGPEYNQANYYSGGAEGPMGGFENLPNPVPAEDMVYSEVGRKIIGGFAGVTESLPDIALAGETYSYSFETEIDPEWNLENIEAIALLLEDNGTVINAAKYEQLVGIKNIKKDALNIYPNPTSSHINISNTELGDLSIYNLNGALVKEISQVEGQISIDVSDLDNGIYFVKLSTEDGIKTTKVSIVK